MLKKMLLVTMMLFMSVGFLHAFEVKNKVEFDFKAGTNDYFLGDYAGSNKHKFYDPAVGVGLHYWLNNHISGGLVYNFSRLGIENEAPVVVNTSMDLNIMM